MNLKLVLATGRFSQGLIISVIINRPLFMFLWFRFLIGVWILKPESTSSISSLKLFKVTSGDLNNHSRTYVLLFLSVST